MSQPETMSRYEFAELRRELGLSMRKLAAQLGLSWTTVYRYETGAVPITSRTALAMRALEKRKEEA